MCPSPHGRFADGVNAFSKGQDLAVVNHATGQLQLKSVFYRPDQLVEIVMSTIIVVCFVSSLPFVYRLSHCQGVYLYLYVKE
jgi:hypothetical protein